MEKIFLIKDLDDLYDFSGREIIALDPVVAYGLSKKGIRYKIPEDYYDEGAMLSNEKEYFIEQLAEFRSLDNFLKENISYCREHDISLVMANYLRCKYVVDTFVIDSYIISRIIEKCAMGKELVYVHQPAAGGESNYSPFFFKSKSAETFFNILRIACEKYNIKFTEHIIGNKTPPAKKNNPSFFSAVKNSYMKRQLKKMLNFFKYQKFNKLLPVEGSLKGTNIFVMHAGSAWIDHPVKELIKNRANVYLSEKDEAIKEDSFFRPKFHFPQLEESFKEILRIECEQCSEKLHSYPLLEWVNTKCGMNISTAIVPFLKYFIKEDCLHILLDTEKNLRFYKKNNIQYLIARANTEKGSMGNILAAHFYQGMKSICIQHACFTQDLRFAGINDTTLYDYLLTAEGTTHKFYGDFLESTYHSECRVILSPHYLQQIRKRYERKRKIKKGREKVVYVVTKFSNGVRSFNNMCYPLTWYYEFQKKLIDFFAAETRFDFIYKHAPRVGQEWAEHTIIKYIKEKGIGNIAIREEDFIKCLRFADKVIVDNPSTTAMFETAAAGKPVISIYPDYLENGILRSGKALFGKSLKPFHDFSEIPEVLNDFLYDNESEYKVDFPASESGFLDALKEITNDNPIRRIEEEQACAV